MKVPPEHKEYLDKPDFVLRCPPEMFSEKELEIFDLYGNWLEALATGLIKPFTAEQRLFVLVAQGKAEPEYPFEKLWIKRMRRIQWQQEHKEQGDKVVWVDPGEVWFPRGAIERMSPYFRG